MYYDPATRELKSADYMAYMHHLRTGEQLTTAQWAARQEQKFNQNHDELGRFTYGWNNTTGRGGSSNGLTSGPPSSTSRQSANPKHTSAKPIRPAPKSSEAENQQAARTAMPKPTHAARPLQREGYTPWNQVGSYPAREYRTGSGAAIIDPRSGFPMLIPRGVSMRETIGHGLINRSVLTREAATTAFLPGARMDFQRTHSTLRGKQGETLIDQRFIAIGNDNFGVYAAASGMSLSRALEGAASVYSYQTGKIKRNSRNESLIVSGYRDFLSGNVGG